MNHLNFPDEELVREIENRSAFVQKTNESGSSLLNSKFFPRYPFKFKETKGKNRSTYLKVDCRYCSVFFSFKREENSEVFRLFRFHNIHDHSEIARNKKEAIQAFLERLPSEIQYKDIKH